MLTWPSLPVYAVISYGAQPSHATKFEILLLFRVTWSIQRRRVGIVKAAKDGDVVIFGVVVEVKVAVDPVVGIGIVIEAADDGDVVVVDDAVQVGIGAAGVADEDGGLIDRLSHPGGVGAER